MEVEELITLRSMAAQLRVSAKWLREEAEAGRIPHLPAGTTILVNPEAVIAALAKRARQSEQRENEDA